MQPAADELVELFEQEDAGAQKMFNILKDPAVQDVKCNRYDRIFYTDDAGPKMVDRVFSTPEAYQAWIDHLLGLTNAGVLHLKDANTPVVEASFRADKTDLLGSIIVFKTEITHSDPALTIRKQPVGIVSLDQMLEQQMMSPEMRFFLENAVRGRLNILLSGGTGAGKTTLARALSWFIDPAQRVITCEEIDELHLADRLHNALALFHYQQNDEYGKPLYEKSLDGLVRDALRARADRIWVGEVRGPEAYALVKACLSGHDGSVTTIHANDGVQAVRQLVSYMMESNLSEEVARDQVAQAFHLVVQIKRARMGRRVISEITELEPVREGSNQRHIPLWVYNSETNTFDQRGHPSPRLIECFERYGVNYDPYAASRGF